MRFPVFSLLAPILTSVVLFMVTGSAYVLLFALMGPVMAGASFLDSRRTRRQQELSQELKAEEQQASEAASLREQQDLERHELLRRFPSSAWWASRADERVPYWAARNTETHTDTKIRVGLLRSKGTPVVIDAAEGICVRGDEVETRSLIRSLATQLSWRIGISAYGHCEMDEQENRALFSRATTPVFISKAREGQISPGVRYVATCTDGVGTLTDLLGLTEDVHHVEYDFLTRVEHEEILRAYERFTTEPNNTISHNIQLRLADPSDALSGRAELPVCVGSTHRTPLFIDLVTDGPHAIIIGRTGAGKTEFIRSWMAALCASYTPESLNIVVVDYKGGLGFSSFANIPHVVAVATDLDHAHATRIVASLSAELRYRERILATADVSSITELDPSIELARLVLVIDEYRALIAAEPELAHVLTDIVARGRALGMHVIVATQRLGGSVADAIVANCTIRVCFPVAEQHEVVSLVGHVDPQLIPQQVGHALITTAVSPPQLFHASQATSENLAELSKAWIAHQRVNWSPRRPWCEPLPQQICLDDAGAPPPGHIWIGLADLPEEQTQSWQTLDISGGAAVLITGGAHTGKTTAAHLFAQQTGATLITTAEQLWDLLTGVREPQSCVIDNWHVLLDELGPEYSEEIVNSSARWLHSLRSQGYVVAITSEEHARGLSKLSQQWTHSIHLVSTKQQGLSKFSGRTLQLAWTQPAAHPQVPATPEMIWDTSRHYVVVSTRPQLFIQKVSLRAALNHHQVSRDLQILEPGLWVADAFQWSQEFSLLKQLSEYATVIIDGYTSSQLRSLQLSSQPLPYTSQDRVVLISPEGEISRATL
jgi:DNA segregation ATPase FtsK/SpoIIIE, S-DNA-T family